MAVRDRPPLALCYHSVSDVPLRDDPHALCTTPADLADQIQRLRRWGYSLVKFSELVRLAGEGKAAARAALTFDDGYRDNLHNLAPLLETSDAVATVFVVSGWLGKSHPDPPGAPMLTQDELRDLASHHRIEIGAHTHTHPDLTTLSYETALEEFRLSKETLESYTDAPVTVAAYPFGSTDASAAAACRAAGFEAACRTSGEGSWNDPFNIPRQDVTNRQTSIGFWLKRDDRYERIASTVPGRALRRGLRKVKARLG